MRRFIRPTFYTSSDHIIIIFPVHSTFYTRPLWSHYLPILPQLLSPWWLHYLPSSNIDGDSSFSVRKYWNFWMKSKMSDQNRRLNILYTAPDMLTAPFNWVSQVLVNLKRRVVFPKPYLRKLIWSFKGHLMNIFIFIATFVIIFINIP